MLPIEIQDKLEVEFVDKYGLAEVIKSLRDICDLKAEHIAINWQEPINKDNSLGKMWTRLSNSLTTCYQKTKYLSNIVQGKR